MTNIKPVVLGCLTWRVRKDGCNEGRACRPGLKITRPGHVYRNTRCGQAGNLVFGNAAASDGKSSKTMARGRVGPYQVRHAYWAWAASFSGLRPWRKPYNWRKDTQPLRALRQSQLVRRQMPWIKRWKIHHWWKCILNLLALHQEACFNENIR